MSGLIQRSLYWKYCASFVIKNIAGSLFVTMIWQSVTSISQSTFKWPLQHLYKELMSADNLKMQNFSSLLLWQSCFDIGLNIAIYHWRYLRDKVWFKMILFNNKWLDIKSKIGIKVLIINWINPHVVLLFWPRKDFLSHCTKNYLLCPSSIHHDHKHHQQQQKRISLLLIFLLLLILDNKK